ncbi:rCG50669 [Rattus norvegicus]|uniref:RCG50669 n=1 Tax=Rattus norvegicus TaxID=10116 RepID=A6KC16_RAT|nr:rCG50669 [Rattus norvegicus]
MATPVSCLSRDSTWCCPLPKQIPLLLLLFSLPLSHLLYLLPLPLIPCPLTFWGK